MARPNLVQRVSSASSTVIPSASTASHFPVKSTKDSFATVQPLVALPPPKPPGVPSVQTKLLKQAVSAVHAATMARTRPTLAHPHQQRTVFSMPSASNAHTQTQLAVNKNPNNPGPVPASSDNDHAVTSSVTPSPTSNILKFIDPMMPVPPVVALVSAASAAAAADSQPSVPVAPRRLAFCMGFLPQPVPPNSSSSDTCTSSSISGDASVGVSSGPGREVRMGRVGRPPKLTTVRSSVQIQPDVQSVQPVGGMSHVSVSSAGFPSSSTSVVPVMAREVVLYGLPDKMSAHVIRLRRQSKKPTVSTSSDKLAHPVPSLSLSDFSNGGADKSETSYFGSSHEMPSLLLMPPNVKSSIQSTVMDASTSSAQHLLAETEGTFVIDEKHYHEKDQHQPHSSADHDVSVLSHTQITSASTELVPIKTNPIMMADITQPGITTQVDTLPQVSDSMHVDAPPTTMTPINDTPISTMMDYIARNETGNAVMLVQGTTSCVSPTNDVDARGSVVSVQSPVVLPIENGNDTTPNPCVTAQPSCEQPSVVSGSTIVPSTLSVPASVPTTIPNVLSMAPPPPISKTKRYIQWQRQAKAHHNNTLLKVDRDYKQEVCSDLYMARTKEKLFRYFDMIKAFHECKAVCMLEHFQTLEAWSRKQQTPHVLTTMYDLEVKHVRKKTQLHRINILRIYDLQFREAHETVRQELLETQTKTLQLVDRQQELEVQCHEQILQQFKKGGRVETPAFLKQSATLQAEMMRQKGELEPDVYRLEQRCKALFLMDPSSDNIRANLAKEGVTVDNEVLQMTEGTLSSNREQCLKQLALIARHRKNELISARELLLPSSSIATLTTLIPPVEHVNQPDSLLHASLPQQQPQQQITAMDTSEPSVSTTVAPLSNTLNAPICDNIRIQQCDYVTWLRLNPSTSGGALFRKLLFQPVIKKLHAPKQLLSDEERSTLIQPPNFVSLDEALAIPQSALRTVTNSSTDGNVVLSNNAVCVPSASHSESPAHGIGPRRNKRGLTQTELKRRRQTMRGEAVTPLQPEHLQNAFSDIATQSLPYHVQSVQPTLPSSTTSSIHTHEVPANPSDLFRNIFQHFSASSTATTTSDAFSPPPALLANSNSPTPSTLSDAVAVQVTGNHMPRHIAMSVDGW